MKHDPVFTTALQEFLSFQNVIKELYEVLPKEKTRRIEKEHAITLAAYQAAQNMMLDAAKAFIGTYGCEMDILEFDTENETID